MITKSGYFGIHVDNSLEWKEHIKANLPKFLEKLDL